jgi:hypothetical protein
MYRECGQRTNAHEDTGDEERERERNGAAANGDETIRGGQRRGAALVCQLGTLDANAGFGMRLAVWE